MTLQEVYTKVRQHLLEQHHKSMKHDDCMYRSPSGLKCAVGCLISDEAYSWELEGKSVEQDEVKDALRASGFDLSLYKNSTALNLLMKLQSIHDDEPVSQWKECLDDVADEYELRVED